MNSVKKSLLISACGSVWVVELVVVICVYHCGTANVSVSVSSSTRVRGGPVWTVPSHRHVPGRLLYHLYDRALCVCHLHQWSPGCWRSVLYPLVVSRDSHISNLITARHSNTELTLFGAVFRHKYHFVLRGNDWGWSFLLTDTPWLRGWLRDFLPKIWTTLKSRLFVNIYIWKKIIKPFC